MKKEEILSAFIYLIMVAAAVIVGMTAVKEAFATYNGHLNAYLFAILSIIGIFLVNVIFLELFHALGGKIGGYKVLSINILGFCWTKKLGKWIFEFSDFDGLTGETKVAPVKEDSKLNWYVYLPLLMYVFELALCIVIYSLALEAQASSPMKWVGIVALLAIIISSMIALYNFVPLKLDSMTDGYRLMLLANPVNKEALREQMRIESLQLEGKEPENIKVFNEVTDFTAAVNLYAVYQCLGKKDFKQAEAIIDNILNQPEKITIYTGMRLVAQKIYLNLVNANKEQAKEFYEKEVDGEMRRFISNDTSMESIRAYILIAGLLDESQHEVQFAINKKAKAMKRVAPSRADIENNLYNEALSLIKNNHPDWNLVLENQNKK